MSIHVLSFFCAGPINITSDSLEIVACESLIPDDRRSDWLKWCRGVDPTLPNHRTLIDGENSATVFNGHERLKDLKYTKANTYVSGKCFILSFLILMYALFSNIYPIVFNGDFNHSHANLLIIKCFFIFM